MNGAWRTAASIVLGLSLGCGRDGGSPDSSDGEEDGGRAIMIRCTGYQDCSSRGACVMELYPVTKDQCEVGAFPHASTRCVFPACGANCVVGPASFDPGATPGKITSFAVGECRLPDAGLDGSISTDSGGGD